MVKTKIYALAIFITILLLASAFTLNWYVSIERENELRELYSSLQRSISSSQLEFEYITEYADNDCELFDEAMKITRTNLVGINKKLEAYKEYLISDYEFNSLKTEQTILYIKIC